MSRFLPVILSLALLFGITELRAEVWLPPTSTYRPAGEAFPYGAPLAGRRIVVSPGHGWVNFGTGWAFQREPYAWTGCVGCDGIREDLLTAEISGDYLVPMLKQAGATVFSCRELDRNAEEVIVDDGDPGYEETGAWNVGTSPSLGYGNDYRTFHAKAQGQATYRLEVPVEGDYYVSVRYAAGKNRCPDTRFVVIHGGIETTFFVDQRIDGSEWLYLGRLRFEPGQDNRILVRSLGDEDCYVIADAVRLGGGFDQTVVGGVPASRPRWQMAALHYLPYLGVPNSAFPVLNDVVARPFYADWQGVDLFLSFHSNANGSVKNANGSSTYRYNCSTDYRWEPMSPELCDEPPGSASLQAIVQDRIVTDLRAEWDPAWHDQGDLVANFGELRELDGIPGVLVESAFHDGVETAPGLLRPDNKSLHDPRFRRIVARAIYRAIVDFLEPGAAYQPEPPTHLVVRRTGQVLTASWRPSVGASGYRVYVAYGGRNFDSGTVVAQTSFTLQDTIGGMTAYVRVTALGPGGESSATEAIGARLRPDAAGVDLLVVSGYDRLDAYVRESQNTGDYPIAHGEAIRTASDIGFDGASNEAVIDGDVVLPLYPAVDWILGRESTETETFSDAEQAAVATYLAGGGCLLVSGSEIGWDLVEKGSASDQVFFSTWLKATYVGDDAGTRSVEPVAGGLFGEIPAFSFDDGTHGMYEVRYPDMLSEAGGSELIARYAGGSGAAVAYDGDDFRVVFLGFPLETVYPAATRAALLARMLAFCVPEPPPVPETGEEATHADEGKSAEIITSEKVTEIPEIIYESKIDNFVSEPTLDVGFPDPGELTNIPRVPDDARESGGEETGANDREPSPDEATSDSGSRPRKSGNGCAAGSEAAGAFWALFALWLGLGRPWSTRLPGGPRPY